MIFFLICGIGVELLDCSHLHSNYIFCRTNEQPVGDHHIENKCATLLYLCSLRGTISLESRQKIREAISVSPLTPVWPPPFWKHHISLDYPTSVMERRGGSNDLQGWQEQLEGRAQRAITQNRPNEKCFSHLHERSRDGWMSIRRSCSPPGEMWNVRTLLFTEIATKQMHFIWQPLDVVHSNVFLSWWLRTSADQTQDRDWNKAKSQKIAL